MFTIRSFILIAFALILSLAGQGYSATNLYYDPTLFSTATSGYSMLMEDFEGIAVTGDQNSTGVDSMVFSDFSVSSGLMSLKVLDDPFIPGRIPQNTGNHAISGSNFLSADTNQTDVADYMLLSFYQPMYVFGLYLIDIENGGTVTINSQDFSVSSTANGGDTFFGVVSDTPFTSVYLNMGNTDSNWSIDNVQAAPVVPEPVSSVLFVIGGSVLAGRRLMRKKK